MLHWPLANSTRTGLVTKENTCYYISNCDTFNIISLYSLLKEKFHQFYEIFIARCTGSHENDNFRYKKLQFWQKDDKTINNMVTFSLNTHLDREGKALNVVVSSKSNPYHEHVIVTQSIYIYDALYQTVLQQYIYLCTYHFMFFLSYHVPMFSLLMYFVRND